MAQTRIFTFRRFRIENLIVETDTTMLITITANHTMEMATEKTQNITQNIILPTKTNTTEMGMM